MLWGNSQESVKHDVETLNYTIDEVIREVLDEHDIAEIDRTSRTKLIHAVLADRRILKGKYDRWDLIQIIEDRLNEIVR